MSIQMRIQMNIRAMQYSAPEFPLQESQKTAPKEEPAEPEQTVPAAPRPKTAEYDEYRPGDRREEPSIGIYSVSYGKDGSPKVRFDDPLKQPEESPAPAQNSPDSKAESCTTNTDQVDREIEHLKAQKEQVEQQLLSSTDPQKLEELKRRMSKIENELQQKDNDAYRRQHAAVF